MAVSPYTFTTELDRFQRNCRLTLAFDGGTMPLSYDDALEFKIEIGKILDSEFPSATDVGGSIDQWKARFFPNQRGFKIEVRHRLHPIRTLALNVKQTAQFSGELQVFIDQAGRQS